MRCALLMESSVHYTARLQIVILATVGILGYVLEGQVLATGAVYGSVIALINTLLLLWRMRPSKQSMLLETHKHLWLFYRSSLERFVIVSVLLVLGMGLLKLAPVAVLISFVLGQFAWVIAPLKCEK